MTESTPADDIQGDDLARIRDVAVRHHNGMVDEFERRYQLMAHDRFSSAFAYGRHKIDALLLAELDALPPSSDILDIGCGTGAYLSLIRSRGHRPAGVEPAPAMRDAAIHDNPDAVVHLGVASAIPFGDAAFDLAMAIEVYRYLGEEDVRAAYDEAWRVLRPGGRFFFTMVNRDSLDGFWVMQRVRERVTTGGINDDHPHCEFTTPASVTADLHAAGFEDIRCAGRLLGPIRLAYKASPMLGRAIARRFEDADDRLSARGGMTRFGGHLICTASKPGS